MAWFAYLPFVVENTTKFQYDLAVDRNGIFIRCIATLCLHRHWCPWNYWIKVDFSNNDRWSVGFSPHDHTCSATGDVSPNPISLVFNKVRCHVLNVLICSSTEDSLFKYAGGVAIIGRKFDLHAFWQILIGHNLAFEIIAFAPFQV